MKLKRLRKHILTNGKSSKLLHGRKFICSVVVYRVHIFGAGFTVYVHLFYVYFFKDIFQVLMS